MYLIIPQEPGHNVWPKLGQSDISVWDFYSGPSDSEKKGQLGAMTIARVNTDGGCF